MDGHCHISKNVQNEEPAMQALPCTRLSPQLKFTKKTEKAAAVALKVTPRKSFCTVAPELSGVHQHECCAGPCGDRRAGVQGTNLRPAGTPAQRYRQ